MIDLLVPEVVALHGVVPGTRKDRGQFFLEWMYENGSGGAESFTDKTGHAVVRIGDVSLTLFVESNGVQRTFLHAYAAADAFGVVDMLYHWPSSSPGVRPPAARLNRLHGETENIRKSPCIFGFGRKNPLPQVSGFSVPLENGSLLAPETENMS